MKKILVVDDSATVRQQVGLALSQAGFKIVEAVDGADGARQIEGSSDLSLVICDVNMPNMSGIEMLEQVKGGGQRASLPVIMLTTEGDPSLIARAKKAGAKGWIVKPFKADLLVSAARKLTAAA
ncbi:MAG TPA: two-component system response regulator [Planctomycetes bacterium]|nr:two-component system response regulator [Planctomycetota bacterium]